MPATLRLRNFPFLAAVSAFLASACAAAPLPGPAGTPPLSFVGQAEKIGPPHEQRGALTLTYRNLLDMPPKLARAIDVIDFFQGKARLADGRCLQLRHGSTTRKFAGAILSSDPLACDGLVKYPLLVSARCSADQKNVTIGTWRVGCRVIGRGRSVIVATKRDDPSWKLELASLSDEELIAVGVIGLHDQGVVRTMGIRPDGKIAFTDFMWFNGPYRVIPRERYPGRVSPLGDRPQR